MLHIGTGNTYNTITLTTPIAVNIRCVSLTRKSYAPEDFTTNIDCNLRVVSHSVFMNYSGSKITLGNRYTHCIIGIGF